MQVELGRHALAKGVALDGFFAEIMGRASSSMRQRLPLAMSTILMGVTAAGMLAIERFRIAEVGEF